MRRFLILVCLCFAALSAFAQAPPLPKMTWVRYYEIERGKDADFMRLVSETFKPVLDDLQKKGKVLEWGVGVPLTMNGEPWTHALYMAMPDWSGVEALDQAIDAAQAASTPQAAQRIAEQSMAVAQSRDVILRHLVQSTTQPKAKPKYIIAETHKIKPGREADAVQLFNDWAKPMFTDLAASGKVDLWGLSTPGVAGAADWSHMVWYFLHDIGDMESVIGANEALEPRKAQGFQVRYRDMSEGMHEQVWRLVAP